jgi:MFS family permease
MKASKRTSIDSSAPPVRTPPLSGPARSRWLNRSILGIGLASLFSDLSHEMATTILPLYLAQQIAASASALGLIEGISDALSSFFKLWGGWWTDRAGKRKPLAVAGYLVTALATSCFALARHWTTVLFLRSLAWAARGGRTEARKALLADSVASTNYGRAFGFERAMDTVGAIIAPLVALGLVSVGFSYSRIFAVALFPGLLAAAAMALLVTEVARTPQPERRLLGDLGKLPHNFRYYVLTVGVFGLGQFAPTLLILRASQLLSQPYGAGKASRTVIGLYVLFNLVQACAAYLFGLLSNRYGSMRLLGISYTTFASASVGFALADERLWLLALLFAVAGLAVGGIEAMESTVAAEILPSDLRGTGFGVLGASNGIGDLLSSALVGALWTHLGPLVGFGMAAGFNLLSVVMLVCFRTVF